MRFEIASLHATADAVTWTIPTEAVARWLQPLDLRTAYNADARRLFSPQTQWRLDYSGAQHGIDWRSPLSVDKRGYVNVTSVMGLYDYGVLPEHIRPVATWHPLQDLVLDTAATCGIPFTIEPGRLLAVCCTEPHEQFPARVAIRLPKPTRLQKVYLLTANLTKPRKSYYPAAEVIAAVYGRRAHDHPLVPPHSMPGLVQHFCPRAFAIPYGSVTSGNPIPDKRCYASITDVVLDPERTCHTIELRSVSTETLLGVLGATLLLAPEG